MSSFVNTNNRMAQVEEQQQGVRLRDIIMNTIAMPKLVSPKCFLLQILLVSTVYWAH